MAARLFSSVLFCPEVEVSGVPWSEQFGRCRMARKMYCTFELRISGTHILGMWLKRALTVTTSLGLRKGKVSVSYRSSFCRSLLTLKERA
jgi:hypothetical protein